MAKKTDTKSAKSARNITSVEMPNGATWNLGSAAFTSDLLELLELIEMGKLEEAGTRTLRLFRSVILSCLQRGGHSADDADALISEIGVDELEDYITHIGGVIGLG